MVDPIISKFFSRSFESSLNENIFLRSFVLDTTSVLSYIEELLSIPEEAYIECVIHSGAPSFITFQDVVQYSSFEDATSKICQILLNTDNNGLSYIETGRLLLDDGKHRKNPALRKYGENHAKTALELGLVQCLFNNNYLTCLGYVYNLLGKDARLELIRRTILRNNFIRKILFKASQGLVSLQNEMSFLAESTIKRRLPNIKQLLGIVHGSDSHPVFSNILINDDYKFLDSLLF